MAILKCKMCGGNLELVVDATVCECEYCGSTQTVPKADDEKKMNLFQRANRLRMACEFDKAAGVYESIVSEFTEEAEAYWGLVLCKYGIEYVDDPKTGKKIPTCHRSSFDEVMEDSNFEMVMEYSDALSRSLYRDEAKEIERIRTRILEVSSKEEPYDIFICYKETDANGDRTVDSVIAQDVYNALTQNGYRVFFSRITLEDKLGQEYEPYIFAALNSAKVMLAFGTDYEYFNAVWVKNEWSRFLSLIEKGEKKTLIPCYKNVDAYDMPKEFARLQAQDMGKVGATQDLLRGIDKILNKEKDEVLVNTPVVQVSAATSSVQPILERAFLFLEDKEWEKAEEYCERVLDMDPRNEQAYVCKFLAASEIPNEKSLENISYTELGYLKRWSTEGFDELQSQMKAESKAGIEVSTRDLATLYYGKAIKFGNTSMKPYLEKAAERCQREAKDVLFLTKFRDVNLAITKERLDAASLFRDVTEDLKRYTICVALQEEEQRIAVEKRLEEQRIAVEKRLEEQRIIAENKKKEEAYNSAIEALDSNLIWRVELAVEKLKDIGDWKDSVDLLAKLEKRLIELERMEKEGAIRQDKLRRCKMIAIATVILIIMALLAVEMIVLPMIRYNGM